MQAGQGLYLVQSASDFAGSWYGEFINVTATNPNWEKWRPRNPTSAHWYDEARLQRYLGAHVARDRDLGQSRTVREFIGEFRGLSGTAASAKCLTRWAAPTSRWPQFFGVDQVNRARHRQAAGRDAAAQQAGRPASISASSALSTSRNGSWRQAVRSTRSSTNAARRSAPTASLTSSSSLLVSIRPGSGSRPADTPRVRHWRQLVRRHQQPVPPVRIHG